MHFARIMYLFEAQTQFFGRSLECFAGSITCNWMPSTYFVLKSTRRCGQSYFSQALHWVACGRQCSIMPGTSERGKPSFVDAATFFSREVYLKEWATLMAQSICERVHWAHTCGTTELSIDTCRTSAHELLHDLIPMMETSLSSSHWNLHVQWAPCALSSNCLTWNILCSWLRLALNLCLNLPELRTVHCCLPTLCTTGSNHLGSWTENLRFLPVQAGVLTINTGK